MLMEAMHLLIKSLKGIRPPGSSAKLWQSHNSAVNSALIRIHILTKRLSAGHQVMR
jgi:hypothetical protein